MDWLQFKKCLAYLTPGTLQDELMEWADAEECTIRPYIKNESGRPIQQEIPYVIREEHKPVLRKRILYSLEADHLALVAPEDTHKIKALNP